MARRRVQKMRVEAEKQAKKMNELLAQISGLSVTYHDAQQKIIGEDANIPKGKNDHFTPFCSNHSIVCHGIFLNIFFIFFFLSL